MKNIYEIYWRLAIEHGHLWAVGGTWSYKEMELVKVIGSAEDPEAACRACKKLSDDISEQVKDLPAPHNYGVFFDPEKPYHTTLTGREHWAIVDDSSLVYQILRPGLEGKSEVVFQVLFTVECNNKVSVYVEEIDLERMKARHWMVLWKACIAIFGDDPYTLKMCMENICEAAWKEEEQI
jgi:hypothetical protein